MHITSLVLLLAFFQTPIHPRMPGDKEKSKPAVCDATCQDNWKKVRARKALTDKDKAEMKQRRANWQTQMDALDKMARPK
jgi:hypothetical protein